jgi:hypothetical protein
VVDRLREKKQQRHPLLERLLSDHDQGAQG